MLVDIIPELLAEILKLEDSITNTPAEIKSFKHDIENNCDKKYLM